MKRVFAIDVLACPRCGGRTRVLSIPPLAPRPDKPLEDALATSD